MRFKLDENLPNEAADLLSTAGHDVTTVLLQGLGGGSDPKLAQVCHREARALVTLDLDFADIRTYPPGDHSGIIVLRPQSQAKTRVLVLLARAIEHLVSETADRRLWIVDESGIRIRGE